MKLNKIHFSSELGVKSVEENEPSNVITQNLQPKSRGKASWSTSNDITNTNENSELYFNSFFHHRVFE